MQNATEIIAIIGIVTGIIGIILMLRFTHFDKTIEEQGTKIESWSSEIKTSLSDEIKKKTNSDIEVVINIVDKLSAVETMKTRLDEICQTMTRSFVFDIVTIFFLILLALVVVADAQFDQYLLLLMMICALLAMADIYAFMLLVREFLGIKSKIKVRKTE